MQKIKQFFGQFRWWETSLLFAYFVAEIVLGVMFKSSILLIFNVLTSACKRQYFGKHADGCEFKLIFCKLLI